MVRQAAIDFNCASWAKVLPSAWTSGTTQDTFAGVDDFEVAEATYRAAIAGWPAAH
jgi:hypothetical protein